jgi:ribosomal protein L40E
MGESLVVADGSSGIGNTEFYLKKVLTGDVEGVRARLIIALERLHYRVLSEQPLQAKRSARGWGSFYVSADVLDYPTKLTVALKALGPATTLVTLDYEVTHAAALSTKGDRQTLRREAEAILALAADHVVPTVCLTCGANNAGDSRFCRLCGAHYAVSVPAELEVLRLTAVARAGHQLNVIGMACALAALLFSLLLIFSGKAVALKLGVLILMLGETTALVIMSFGASYVHNALNPKEQEEQQRPSFPANAARTLPPLSQESLPPRSIGGSVTEGTTELLELQSDEGAPAALGHQKDKPVAINKS